VVGWPEAASVVEIIEWRRKRCAIVLRELSLLGESWEL